MQIIKSFGIISEKKLMTMIWRDVDNTKFENVIGTCLRTGKVRRDFKSPLGEAGIYYKYIGD